MAKKRAVFLYPAPPDFTDRKMSLKERKEWIKKGCQIKMADLHPLDKLNWTLILPDEEIIELLKKRGYLDEPGATP